MSEGCVRVEDVELTNGETLLLLLLLLLLSLWLWLNVSARLDRTGRLASRVVENEQHHHYHYHQKPPLLPSSSSSPPPPPPPPNSSSSRAWSVVMRRIDDDACSWIAASFTLSTLMGENIFILIYPEYFLQLIN
ncbi:hypothetical protein T07_14969 [Trichinella nelsoni]|uniref:Uncharacterized protein n=1 Tax=Trichinella nelsoni TaxID=6336 RepID=A0A0V0S4V1_9BILA|nr:hypothetical protein T07_14969 [Trichinella nelsoni]